MPLFFLHQRRGSAFIADLEGAEFDDLAAAREEALLAAREVLQEMIGRGLVDLTGVFEIEGPDGQRTVVPFADAVRVQT